MKRNGISRLLQRYLAGRRSGRDAYFDADEIDELLDSFEEAEDYTYYDELLALGMRLHPGNPDLQVRQCKSYVYNEDYDSALALIESIAETDNQDLDMLRLECYVMQDAYDKVIGYVEKLIADRCDYLETIFEYIAPILGDMEMDEEAHDFIRRGLLLFPDNLILKDELCYNLEIEGDIGEAIRVCNELIDQNPYSNDYWFSLGRLYSISGDFEKAIEAFDFALTCDDSDDELKVLKAYCLYMNENYEKAIEVYNDIATTDETRTRVLPQLAECHVKLEEYEKAYGLLKELLKENRQEDPGPYINYVRCCVETGRDKEASDVLMQAARMFPKSIRVLSLLALAYLENGDEQKVRETTERIFSLIDRMEEMPAEEIESLYRTGQYLHIAMDFLTKGDLKHFSEHYRQTAPEELARYLGHAAPAPKWPSEPAGGKHIPPEDLVKEFLKNKDNKN